MPIQVFRPSVFPRRNVYFLRKWSPHHSPRGDPRQKHRAQFRIPMGGSQKARARFDAVFDARGRADGVCARTWAQRVSPHVHLRANACIQPWAPRVSVNMS